jgi:GNAT superfamily N-acetyltransferase
MSEAASLQSASEHAPGARRATSADTSAASATLARAFYDDPMMVHLLPDDAVRPEKLPRLFALLFRLALPFGATDVTPGHEAVALWRPPNQWHMPFWQYIVHSGTLLGVFGRGTLKVMQTMDLVEKLHPKEPHWYLQAIGTDPESQGKGFGGRVMRHQLAEVDAAGMPAYLESSKEKNIPIYQSFGFEVTGEIKVPDGPILYPMWRKARR